MSGTDDLKCSSDNAALNATSTLPLVATSFLFLANEQILVVFLQLEILHECF